MHLAGDLKCLNLALDLLATPESKILATSEIRRLGNEAAHPPLDFELMDTLLEEMKHDQRPEVQNEMQYFIRLYESLKNSNGSSLL